jgi:hypothetical protein
MTVECFVKLKCVLFHLQFWHTLKMADLKEELVCQFFFKTWQKCYRHVQTLKAAFGQQAMRRTQVLSDFGS